MATGNALLARLSSKLALEILPAVVASLIGGALLTHFGLGRVTAPATQGAPASPEMMQLLRDEHGAIMQFLQTRLDNEKRQLAAEEALPRVPAGAATAVPPVYHPDREAAAKPVRSGRGSSTGSSPAPIVIARLGPSEAGQNEADKTSSVGAAPPVSGATDARPLSLFRPMSIKDQVVAVTQHVVSIIGGIPSWIGSLGGHLGSGDVAPRRPADGISTS
jgi:hypothetical protein